MAPTTEVVTARPAPALAGFIDHYLGYRMTGYPPGLHRGLPSRHLTFIVAIGPTIDVVAQTDPAQSPRDYRCVVSGLQAVSASIASPGDQEGVAIALTPMGCRTLFGLPARALWNTSLECSELTGRTGDELWERLQGPASWRSRFATCDAVLGRWADPERIVSPELAWAWRALVGSGGTASIAPLAQRVGWTRQHLARRFGAEFGVSPKLAGRITRFERARRMIESTPPHITIAQVAAACGYYDQSHLDRDFAELAGCSPTAWLASEVTSVQDDAGAAGRSWDHDEFH